MTFVMATVLPCLCLILAEGGGGGGGGEPTSPGGLGNMWIGLMLALVVFWIITMRGGSRDKKRRQAMLDNLAKNDRVLTIGGIVGSIVVVKGDEVVIKVDETNNTKITFTRSAVQKVLTDNDQEK